MQIEHKITEDGSSTLYVPVLDEYYHSVYGAIQESLHVFIRAGYNCCNKKKITIFEMGFGTGLNALLTFIESIRKKEIQYLTIENYPLKKDITDNLNYLQNDKMLADVFNKMHSCDWNKNIDISNTFHLHKIQGDILNYNFNTKIDLVYFDAFAPGAQPELWTYSVFEKIYKAMNPGGIMVTYCAKGEVRRNMIKCGFSVERLAGPPGKREMLRGRKNV